MRRVTYRRWRSIGVLGLSVVVLAVLVGYAALTPAERVYASTSVSWAKGPGEVLYGWAHNTTGGAIKTATIQVVKFGPGGKKIVYASGRTSANGTYRIGMRLPRNTYWVLIRMGGSGSGKNKVAALRHSLAPGMHLKADAKVVQSTHFWILPISIY